ncbi:ATP-binding protein [Halobellus limi]|uniref:ATP-binding protein n=1 Tax=Halobellus limi TaxID=699433 RepID=UPI001F0CF70D|nr:ATP-binding protein [Halobellus limi]
MLAEDADRDVLRVNERFLELFGIPAEPEDVIGDDCEAFAARVSDLFVDPDGFVSRIDELIEGGEPVWNDELVLEDGRAFERNYRPIELPDGGGHLWVYYDVTEREERERRLEALNETARELMAAETCEEVAEIGVDAAKTIIGLDANVVNLYREGEGLVPVAATETARDLVGELPTFAAGEGIAWRVFESGEAKSIDDVQSDPDVYNPETPIRSEMYVPLGEYGILIAGSPTRDAFDDEDVVLSEILGINIVTALEQVQRNERIRERERELTRQNARLEEFASVVSHDLRNPLNVASGRLDLAREECDSEQLEYVADAHDRMGELIDDLLTLARERDTDIEPTPIALDSFVRACWRNVDTGDAEFTLDVEGAISADETQLRQLFENLLRNAVEHGGDAVRVGTLEDADGFYVEDDGPGIPPDKRGDVFEYGYSTTQGGTGFGLSIAKQCVEAHGWEIRVTDGAEGGARFEITGVDIGDAE